MKVDDAMTIQDALKLMRREQVLRMPVVNADGVLQGILSIKDLVQDSEMGAIPSVQTPPAFDERGYSPIERVFNEPED